MQNRERFIQEIIRQFPALSGPLSEAREFPLVAPHLIAPLQIKLSQDVLQQARAFASALFRLRQNEKYRSWLQATNPFPNTQLLPAGNFSLFMSYDFHLSPEGVLKLIEVNTNAAFLVLGELLYSALGLKSPVSSFSWNELKKSFENEFYLATGKQGLKKIAIIDDHPEAQRLYIEFLACQELFKSWGWEVQVLDYRSDLSSFDFIYNRGTDFYWQDPSWKQVCELFNSKTVGISPNPFEYYYLADKQRLTSWCRAENLTTWQVSSSDQEILLRHLPKSEELNSSNSDEIWSRRKQLFFKPQRAFGSKQSYKGASVSRRVFQEMLDQDFLAQEYLQAPEIQFDTGAGVENLKYDLRFYAYQDQIQSVIARVYQGQVTNLQSPLGGFATLKFD